MGLFSFFFFFAVTTHAFHKQLHTNVNSHSCRTNSWKCNCWIKKVYASIILTDFAKLPFRKLGQFIPPLGIMKVPYDLKLLSGFQNFPPVRDGAWWFAFAFLRMRAEEQFFCLFNSHLSFLLYELSVCVLCLFFLLGSCPFFLSKSSSYIRKSSSLWYELQEFLRGLSCVFLLCTQWFFSYYSVFAIKFCFNVVKFIHFFLLWLLDF